MLEQPESNESIPVGALRIRDLSCRYWRAGLVDKWIGKKEGGDVISGLDLDVPPKTVVALLGPSGSGKTTFLRALGMTTPDSHPALKANTVLEVNGTFNGKKIRSTNQVGGYVSKHFELLDEPLRGKKGEAIKRFAEELGVPPEKKSRGVFFGTHYMSQELLKAVDKVLIMDNPPIYGASYEPHVLERLQMYFENVEREGERRLVPYVDVSPEEEARGHDSSVEDLIAYFADAIKSRGMREDMVRELYRAQVHSFEDSGTKMIRRFLPAICYAKTRDILTKGLRNMR